MTDTNRQIPVTSEQEAVFHAFEERIGYHFKDMCLLITACTHASWANEHHAPGYYERLEFLGDAVLEVVASEHLFRTNPSDREGELTKKRASMVCEVALAHCARILNLQETVLLGRGVENDGGRERDALLADVMEAVTGAIYLDGGFDAAAGFIRTHILEKQSDLQLFLDSKTMLQELVQGHKLPPISYQVVEAKGPQHKRIYTCEARIGKEIMGRGEGTSKKAAEQKAADQALVNLRARFKD